MTKPRNIQDKSTAQYWIDKMVGSWQPPAKPGAYDLELRSLAASILSSGALSTNALKDAFQRLRPREESAHIADLFAQHGPDMAQGLQPPAGPKPGNVNVAKGTQQLCSIRRMDVLRREHVQHRPFLQNVFGASCLAADKVHLINFASVSDGLRLADYLSIQPAQVLQLKTTKSMRVAQADGSSALRPNDTYRKLCNKVQGFTKKQGIIDGAVVIFGHRTWEVHFGESLCSFLRAGELITLLGENFQPSFLTVLFCGSQSYAQEMTKLLPVPPVQVNAIAEDQEFCSHPARGETLEFLYAGPDVTRAEKNAHLFNETHQGLLSVLER